MNLSRKSLSFAYLIGLFFTLFTPVLFPSLRIQFFIPFIIILFYNRPFIKCLWGSLFCGLLIDLLSPHTHLGLYAINYTLVTGILFAQKRSFFADSLTTLPIMVFFYSALSSIFQILFINIFETKILPSPLWLFKDVLIYSCLDSTFAFAVFILPFYFFGKPIRKGKDYFMEKEA